MSSVVWGSDVPVSMPEPLPREGLVPMFGFVFTIDGLFHDIGEADLEALSTPTYAPIRPMSDVVFDDGDIEEDD